MAFSNFKASRTSTFGDSYRGVHYEDSPENLIRDFYNFLQTATNGDVFMVKCNVKMQVVIDKPREP